MPPLRFDTEEQASQYLHIQRGEPNAPPETDEDLAEAIDALDRAEADNAERKVLWRMLAAYQMFPSYTDFCDRLGLRYSKKESQFLYDLSRTSYTAAWQRYGWTRLQVMCRIGWNGLYLNDWKLM